MVHVRKCGLVSSTTDIFCGGLVLVTTTGLAELIALLVLGKSRELEWPLLMGVCSGSLNELAELKMVVL